MEQWKQWIPSTKLNAFLYVSRIEILGKELKLTCEYENLSTLIILRFKSGVLAYRDTYETALLQRFEDITIEKADSEVEKVKNWNLFVVVDSQYVQEFKKETLGAYSNLNITHYIISSDDAVTEILSLQPPSIEVLDGKA